MKKNKFLVVTAILMFVSSVTVTIGSQNLLINPGFETGSISPFLSWNNGIETVKSKVYSGKYSAKIFSGVGSVQQVVSGLSPNTKYELRAVIKLSSTSDVVSLRAFNYGGADVTVAANATRYTEYKLTFTTGATNTTAEISVYKPSGGLIYVDNFSLTMVQQTSTNLFANGNFETGTLSSWVIWNNGIQTTNVYEGNYAGVINAGTNGSLQQDITVSPNTAYTATVWAKVSTAGETALFMDVDNNVTTTINSTTFQKYYITFTTTSTQTKVTISVYKDIASYGNVYVDAYTLTPGVSNIPPSITSPAASTSGEEGIAYSYTLTAVDANAGDVVTLSAPTLPSWLSFNASTGVLSGTPTSTNVGINNVTLRASDGAANTDMSFAITVLAAGSTTIVDTWIFAGQSNSEGYGITENPVSGLSPSTTLSSIGRSDLNTTNTNVMFFKGFGDVTSSAGMTMAPKNIWHDMLPYEGLTYDWGSGKGNESGRRFGSELSFGKNVAQTLGAKIAIIKFAMGSTPIASSTILMYDNTWQDFDPSDGGRANQYDKIINTVNSAVASLPAGIKLRVRGVCWMQGETDAGVAPNSYQANLTEFIAALKNDLSVIASNNSSKIYPYTATWSTLPFLIGSIAGTSANSTIVRNAQTTVANNTTNAFIVDGTNNITLMSSDDWGGANIHYDTQGQVTLGERFAAAATSNTLRSVKSFIEQEKVSPISVYPNPVVNSKLFISVPGELENSRINILDLTGKVVKSTFFSTLNNGQDLDISVCGPGMYFIEFLTPETRIVKTFIKK